MSPTGALMEFGEDDVLSPVLAGEASWPFIDATVRYTGAVTKTPEGEIEPALFRGVTIYRFISTALDEYGYPEVDAFYADEALTELIAARHD